MRQPIEIKPSENPRVPAQPAPYFHEVPLQIRFNDIDMLGHLNNGVYLNFMDLGKINYFNDVMGRKLDMHDISLAVVNINVNFYAPTFITCRISVFTAVTHISKHSLTLDQRIIDTVTGEVKCQASTIMAGYNIKTATSEPINTEWREAIERWEGRELFG